MIHRLLADYHLVALQETKFTKADNLRVVTNYINTADSKAQVFWFQRNDDDFTGHAGVALIISGSHPFTSVEDVYANADHRARYLVLDARIEDFQVFLHVVYAPVAVPDQKRFFDSLPTRFPDAANHLVLGDLNTPLDPLLNEATPYPHDQGRDELQAWMLELGVMDPWRATFPDQRTFSDPKQRNRIDYCLLTTDLYDGYYRESRYVTDKKWYHEDHYPVEFHLASPSQPDSKRLPWKCPRWLLEVPILFPGSNPGILLAHKAGDRAFLREMQRALKTKDDKHLATLRANVHMARALDAVCSTADIRADLTKAQGELKALQDLFADRRQKTKLDRDVTEREQGSAYFLPTNVAYHVSIPNATLPDGTVTTDPAEMAAEHRHYWGSLYQSPSWDLRDTVGPRRFDPIKLQDLLKYTTARLTQDQSRALDAPLTANDFYWAITNSPKGRSAGYDGLRAEYYQLNPSVWAQVYEMVYASNFDRGKMSKSQQKAYISLLFKVGDRSFPSNYRPITLTNHDAKFGPKILAWRLRDILPVLLHSDQSGFVKGRSICHALLRIQDLQTLAKRRGWTDAGAVLLDYAKAFDSVLWDALLQVLRHMGFSEVFCNWIMTFSRSPLVSVLVNGTASKPSSWGAVFDKGTQYRRSLRAVHLTASLLPACYYRIPVPGCIKPHHLLAFADDCTGLLRRLRDAPAFVDAVRGYAEADGLRLNVHKTHIFRFAPLPPDLRMEIEAGGWDVIADDGEVRVLGIFMSPSLPTSARFPALIDAMVKRCTLWRFRARTLLGRATILRAIGLPLLWYTAAVTVVPEDVVTQVKRLCKSFLYKRDISADQALRGPMAEEWMYLPTSHGGLGLPETTAFSRALQLCSLRDAIYAVRPYRTIPGWFAAAYTLFSGPLEFSGEGFDLLYAPVPNGITIQEPWTGRT